MQHLGLLTGRGEVDIGGPAKLLVTGFAAGVFVAHIVGALSGAYGSDLNVSATDAIATAAVTNFYAAFAMRTDE
ncbi:hypothetical protein N9089_03550 [Crocinitomicaceae bacterium]|nr:hypothetical protein [Crocinitomicaceae bacterium]